VTPLEAALGCPDCDSEVTATREGVVLHVQVAHDQTCPLFERASGGQPFTAVALLGDQAGGRGQ
jgi:hypothetical protein